MKFLITTIGVVISLVITGCHSKPAPAPSGQSSFQFVEPQPPVGASASITLEEPKSGDYFKEARSIPPLATPVYPRRAAEAKAGLAKVGVHITVDADGRVTEVGPSMLAVSLPSQFDQDFQEAVRVAVMQWRFSPAQSYHIEVTKDAQGEYQYHQTKRENTATYFDVSFTFMSNGTVLGTPDK